MSSAAIRQQRHRQRTRAGRIVLNVEVDEVALTEELIEGGFLNPSDVDDRSRVEAALERLLVALCCHA